MERSTVDVFIESFPGGGQETCNMVLEALSLASCVTCINILLRDGGKSFAN